MLIYCKYCNTKKEHKLFYLKKRKCKSCAEKEFINITIRRNEKDKWNEYMRNYNKTLKEIKT